LIGTILVVASLIIFAFLIWFFWGPITWLFGVVFGGESEVAKMSDRTDCENTHEEMMACDGDPPEGCAEKQQSLSATYTDYTNKVINGEVKNKEEIEFWCSRIYLAGARNLYKCICSCPKCDKDTCEKEEAEVASDCYDTLLKMMPAE
jgi:hypothetical protein